MRLLFVCTGNLCRSPLAERLTAHRLHGAGVHVASAGLRARDGLGMDPSAAVALRELGGDDEGFRSRRLTPEHVRDADLVLTMTHRQRDETLALAPTALRRTFVLSEAAALAADLTESDLRHGAEARVLVAALAAGRARRTGRPTTDADVPDPIGLPLEIHRSVAAQVDALVSPLITLLAQTTLADDLR
jgi:protein-tyrosine phosphatase